MPCRDEPDVIGEILQRCLCYKAPDLPPSASAALQRAHRLYNEAAGAVIDAADAYCVARITSDAVSAGQPPADLAGYWDGVVADSLADLTFYAECANALWVCALRMSAPRNPGASGADPSALAAHALSLPVPDGQLADDLAEELPSVAGADWGTPLHDASGIPLSGLLRPACPEDTPWPAPRWQREEPPR